MCGVKSRKADASTNRIPCFKVQVDRCGFVGLFAGAMNEVEAERPIAEIGLEPRIAVSIRSSDSPVAPKNANMPAFEIDSTNSAEAMPFAIAPVTYGKRRRWSVQNAESPSRDDGIGDSSASTLSPAFPVSAIDPPSASAGPESDCTMTIERFKSPSAVRSNGSAAVGT